MWMGDGCVDGRWLCGWEVVVWMGGGLTCLFIFHYGGKVTLFQERREGGREWEEESGREEGREGERGGTLYQCSLIPQGLWWLSR